MSSSRKRARTTQRSAAATDAAAISRSRETFSSLGPIDRTSSFERAVTLFMDVVEGRELNAATITLFTIYAIRTVEEVTKNTDEHGPAKKDLALRLLKHWVHHASSDLSEEEQMLLMVLVDEAAPGIIDGLFSADHGHLLKKGTKRLVALCCGGSTD